MPDWTSSVLGRYTAFTVTTAGLLGLCTGLLNPAADIDTVRSILTTLATAEASVLAIVFSVTVVALQLVVNRYAARLTSLFSDDPHFRTTFGLFVIAIGFNLGAVYVLPVVSLPLRNAAVGVAFGLAVAATVALYQFIQLMIARSAPEELIAWVRDRKLVPAEYLPDTAAEFMELDVHPIRPLYHIITRAIESGEYQAAAKGIDSLETVLIETFDYIEDHRTPAAEFAETVASDVLTGYFPPIVDQLYEHEQYELVSTTIETTENVGQSGLDHGFYSVTEDAAAGLGDIFDRAPLVWEGNRVRDPCREALVALTKGAATRADHSTFTTTFHHLDHQMTVLLRRRPSREVTDYLISDYYIRDSVDIFETVISHYGPASETEDVNWVWPTDSRISTLPDEAEPVRHFWREYAQFTTTVLQYRLSEDEYPFASGNIGDGWFRMAKKAAEKGFPGLATLFCMSSIELAYSLNQIEETPPGQWVNSLANIRIDYGPEIVDDAFENFRAEGRPEGASITVGTGQYRSEDTDRGVVARILNSEPEHPSFEEWLKEFHVAVEERTRYLRNKDD